MNAASLTHNQMPSRIFAATLLVCFLSLACNKKTDSENSKPKTAKLAWKLPDEISLKLDALRKAGEPTTAEEMRRLYETTPLVTNAAPLYTNAFALLPAPGSFGYTFLSDGISNLPQHSAVMPKGTLDVLAKFCTENAALFDSLKTAARVKECRYSLDFHESLWDMPLTHVTGVGRCARAIRANCYLLIERGQIDAAVELIGDQVASVESLDRDPFLVSQLARSAWLTQCERTLERLLNRKKLDTSQLAQLEQAFQGISFKEGFTRALASERCSTIVICQRPAEQLKDMDILGLIPRLDESSANSSRWAQLDIQSYRESATFVQDILFALQSFEILIKAVDTPFPEALEVAKAFTSNVIIAQTNRYVFASLVTPSLRRTVERYAEGEARLRVTRGALAMERMRLVNNGRLPENADDPAVRSALSGLTDPFDGKPIRYKRRAANSYVIYSIGPDEKDDGGIPKEGAKDKTNYDLVLMVTR